MKNYTWSAEARKKIIEELNTVSTYYRNLVAGLTGDTKGQITECALDAYRATLLLLKRVIEEGTDEQAETEQRTSPNIVKCKDCFYFYKSKKSGGYTCMNSKGLVECNRNTFCNYGERKNHAVD
jgi:hypothetical protein